ncbi:uncharacterized protein N7503_003655 [Penicillium pulvis]|uniref:uncharacterized protein n=1 Tax=Penicillium pulvis TaxID=1562058 RepID=UPI0025485E53|nr:uncharacterized protein N7503_003655 [Penicillium pulvis]KAJ5806053.1 hypothetical protein N7503_003655 [Penicillium pulvis]
MVQFLDLPDELILVIVNYVQAEKGQGNLPFYKWGDLYERAIKQDQPQQNKDLQSLYLVSRRFYRLLKQNYYENICVREGPFHNHPLDRLKRTLRDEPNLQKFIVSAVVPCTTSIYDFFCFYWFPNIQSLSILGFKAMDPLEDENGLRQFIGKSPVTALNLIRCGAHEEALATILSWPAALEVLHYDVEQGEWDGIYVDEPAEGWTCAAFVRTLQPQMGSLKELTLTRPWLDHEGLFNGPRICLRDFTALTTLRIYHVFLCGLDDPLEAWRSLPRSLEELEIFYDDWDLTTFEEDEFLVGLLVHKEEHLPHLRRISIASPEIIWDAEKEECKPAGRWSPPPPLVHALEVAGLDLDVQLGV